jgi:hypothetical protein
MASKLLHGNVCHLKAEQRRCGKSCVCQFAATASAAGSPKRSAPIAEASTTLTGTPISPDDRRGFRPRAHSQAPDLGQNLARRQRAWRLDRLFKNGEQLALQRAMMSGRPCLQPLNHLFGSVFDRQVDRHLWFQISSILKPI